MPAPADRVFTVAADTGRLNQWLPEAVTVLRTDEPEVDVDVHDTAGEHRETGVFDARPEQLRLEWAQRGSPDYSGWLQVFSADGGASSATLHLSFHGDQPANHGGTAAREVDQRLDEALAKLAELVAQPD